MHSPSSGLYSELDSSEVHNRAELNSIHNAEPYSQSTHGGLQVAYQECTSSKEALPQEVSVLAETQYSRIVAPPFEGSDEKSYIPTTPMIDQNHPGLEVGSHPKQRHIKKWIIIVLLILVIVVIAAVVGGVVASKMNQTRTFNQPRWESRTH